MKNTMSYLNDEQNTSSRSQKRTFWRTSLFAGITALGLSASLHAAPIVFTGDAVVNDPIGQTSNGFLTDFLSAVPEPGDILSFSVTFDPDTFGQPIPTGDATLAAYPGGITASSLTIGGVTLNSSSAPELNQVLVTSSNTAAFGIPGFVDGIGFTAGGDSNNGGAQRWAINFFFLDKNGGLTDLSAPTAFPALDDFAFVGLGYRSFRGTQFDGFGSLLLSLDAVSSGGMDGGNMGGGMDGGNMDGGGMGGGMSGGQPTAVPEPSTIGLLALGLITLLRHRRR